MITLTPLYDGLLAEALSRARAAEAAGARGAAAARLHTGGPTGRCLGCGLSSPCPTAALLDGSLTLQAALAVTEEALLALATAQQIERDRAVAVAIAAVAIAAVDGATPATEPPAAGDDARELPAMPSAAEIFAPNPAFNRALTVLLGGAG